MTTVFDRLDQLEQSATAGPWRVHEDAGSPSVADVIGEHELGGEFVVAGYAWSEDAELIAFSRNHLRALIDVARAYAALDRNGSDETLSRGNAALAVLEQEAGQ